LRRGDDIWGKTFLEGQNKLLFDGGGKGAVMTFALERGFITGKRVRSGGGEEKWAERGETITLGEGGKGDACVPRMVLKKKKHRRAYTDAPISGREIARVSVEKKGGGEGATREGSPALLFQIVGLYVRRGPNESLR